MAAAGGTALRSVVPAALDLEAIGRDRGSFVRRTAVALSRDRRLAQFAQALTAGAEGRVARLGRVFAFVSHLVDIPSTREVRDGASIVIALAGENAGPAVLLGALLKSLGERVSLDVVADVAVVRVELALEDLERLPPHARLIEIAGQYHVALDPRRARTPLGFLPRFLREAIAIRLRPLTAQA